LDNDKKKNGDKKRIVFVLVKPFIGSSLPIRPVFRRHKLAWKDMDLKPKNRKKKSQKQNSGVPQQIDKLVFAK
jgi:hypothetical protein